MNTAYLAVSFAVFEAEFGHYRVTCGAVEGPGQGVEEGTGGRREHQAQSIPTQNWKEMSASGIGGGKRGERGLEGGTDERT
jgi:hypothetical protein